METMVKLNTTGILIGAAIACLVGVLFITILADQTVQVTGLTPVASKSLDISGAVLNGGTINTSYEFTLADTVTTGTFKAEYPECAVSTIVLKNQTGSDMTLTTHYLYTAGTGVLTLKNVAVLNQSLGAQNTTYVSYSYCPAGYVSSWGGTVADMVPGFFALAILGACIVLVVKLTKKED